MPPFPEHISDFANYHYHSADMLWLLLLIPVLWAYQILVKNRRRNFLILPVLSVSSVKTRMPEYVSFVLLGIESIAMGLIIIAIARPQNSEDVEYMNKQYNEGIDIILAMDISGSMLAEDFTPNRLEAAKMVAEDFVKNRKYDNMGLVVYEGAAFLQCPLTNDKDFLISFIRKLEAGSIQPGTAIGTGLGTAAGHLYKSKAKSKVVILVTDGVSNTGQPPITAADAAKEFGIRVYTIGIGTNGTAITPMRDPMGFVTRQRVPVEIDEEVLTEIAERTGGRYFRATDNEELIEIYAEIDQLEKSRIETISYRSDPPEAFFWPLMIGAALFLLSYLIKNLFFNGISEIH
jgi:Ca-activated chloride channel family protein